MITAIDQVIPEKNIIFFSPHYDDVLFMSGGYLHQMRNQGLLGEKNICVKLIYSKSNYQARSGDLNYDRSLARVQFATGVRYLEDVECLDELIGAYAYAYETYQEEECLVRGKTLADFKFEFPHGMFPDFWEVDWEIYHRLVEKISNLAQQEDTALIFPMAIKEHLDHFILREAAAKVMLEGKSKATFYFQEDKPYGGLANEEEWQRTEDFILNHGLESINYEIDSEEIVRLAFKHYVSQVNETSKEGVLKRGKVLQEKYGHNTYLDRICVYRR